MKLTQKPIILYFFITLILLPGMSSAWAKSKTFSETNLKVTPKNCIALRQGQVCYQEVVFNWTYPERGNYCLINLSTNQVLNCWQNTNQGKFELDFQSTTTTDFVLRAEGQDTDLSTARIVVSWVFKSSKRPKSSWKLF